MERLGVMNRTSYLISMVALVGFLYYVYDMIQEAMKNINRGIYLLILLYVVGYLVIVLVAFMRLKDVKADSVYYWLEIIPVIILFNEFIIKGNQVDNNATIVLSVIFLVYKIVLGVIPSKT